MTETNLDTLTRSIVEHLHAEYRSQHARSVRRGLEIAMKQGRPVSFVPLGYQMVWGEKGREVQIDPTRAPLVVKAFQLVNEGRGIREAARMLEAEGLTGRKGKLISASTLGAMLRNPFYCGNIRYRGEVYPGNYQPLICAELFIWVQERLARHAQVGEANATKVSERKEADLSGR